MTNLIHKDTGAYDSNGNKIIACSITDHKYGTTPHTENNVGKKSEHKWSKVSCPDCLEFTIRKREKVGWSGDLL